MPEIFVTVAYAIEGHYVGMAKLSPEDSFFDMKLIIARQFSKSKSGTELFNQP